jgi:CO dehydrogenase/acetyl-CoA synthase delta subunit
VPSNHCSAMLHALLPTLPACRMKHHHAEVMLTHAVMQHFSEVLPRGCNWGCRMVHSTCYRNMVQHMPEHPVHTDPKQPNRPSSLVGNHKAGGQ